jgi:hypothetical protein
MAKKENKEDTIIKKLKDKVDKAQSFIETHYIAPKWGYYDNLYFAHREKSADADAWRMNVFIPIIWQTIADILPRFIEGIFGNMDFYSILPQDKESEKSTKQARSFEVLLGKEMEMGNLGEAVLGASNYSLRYGIGWIKAPWEYEKGNKEYFDIKSGKLVEVAKEITISDNPVFSAPDPRAISWNADAKCFDDIRYMIECEEITRGTLEGYKDKPDLYDVKVINEILDDLPDDDDDRKAIFDPHLDFDSYPPALNEIVSPALQAFENK